MDANDIKNLAEVIFNIASTAAILAAAWWFLVTTKFKKRIQFDLECNFLPLKNNDRKIVAELLFILENTGLIEHHLFDLSVSVHALKSETNLNSDDNNKQLKFKERIFRRDILVPPEIGYYYIRPGVKQVITHIIDIPSSISVIRVTAGFSYKKYEENKESKQKEEGRRTSPRWFGVDRYPHTARRVFKVPEFKGIEVAS